MTAASSSALSTVTGLVLDIGTSFNNSNQQSSTNNNINTSSSSSNSNHNRNQSSSADPNVRPDSTRNLKSLRVPPPAAPLLLFDAPVPTVVSQSALHIFTQGATSRPTAVPLNIVQTRVSASTNPAPPHAAVAATHAAILPGPRLAVAHDDGCVVVFSMAASRVAAFEAATPPHPSPTTALAALHPAGLAVARRDGSVHLLNAALQPIHSLPAPDLCAAPFTPMLTSAAAVALFAVVKEPLLSSASSTGIRRPTTSANNQNKMIQQQQHQTALAVAYDNGVICTFSNAGHVTGVPFFAHAGAPKGVVTMFGHDLIFTAGNASDRCLAVFDRRTGRCLARRFMQYTPTCLHAVSSAVTADTCATAPVCPSTTALLVGGDEAQVEVFRVVALSSRKVDIKLVRTIGERQRGKRRNIVQIVYRHDSGGYLSAVCENGDVRRWQLGRGDAAQLGLLEEDRWTAATYTEANILQMILLDEERTPVSKKTDEDSNGVAPTSNNNGIESSNDHLDQTNNGSVPTTTVEVAVPPESQVHVANGVVHAQSILATILDDRQVPEDKKDNLVTTFQHMQTDMRAALVDADKDVRRARRRIFVQFAAGVKDEYQQQYHGDTGVAEGDEQNKQTARDPLEVRLAKETKRAAAFEAEYVTRRYVEHVHNVERVTVDKMKTLLGDFLKGLNNSDSLILQQAMRDVDMLGTEDAEEEVD